jgi:hypothetical protein
MLKQRLRATIHKYIQNAKLILRVIIIIIINMQANWKISKITTKIYCQYLLFIAICFCRLGHFGLNNKKMYKTLGKLITKLIFTQEVTSNFTKKETIHKHTCWWCNFEFVYFLVVPSTLYLVCHLMPFYIECLFMVHNFILVDFAE